MGEDGGKEETRAAVDYVKREPASLKMVGNIYIYIHIYIYRELPFSADTP